MGVEKGEVGNKADGRGREFTEFSASSKSLEVYNVNACEQWVIKSLSSSLYKLPHCKIISLSVGRTSKRAVKE